MLRYFVPLPDAPRQYLLLDATKVSAGFPSPAADYVDSRLDINEYLVRNPVSTFLRKPSQAKPT